MNLNITPLNFKANLVNVGGKSNSSKTARKFDSAIAKLQYSRELAVKSQQYLESYETKSKIIDLPVNDTIEFHNLEIKNGKIDVEELSHKAPYLIYQTTQENALGLAEFTDDIDFNYFEFELDENGNLNTDEADEWLESKLTYYYA